jgi:hypothetical protein
MVVDRRAVAVIGRVERDPVLAARTNGSRSKTRKHQPSAASVRSTGRSGERRPFPSVILAIAAVLIVLLWPLGRSCRWVERQREPE